MPHPKAWRGPFPNDQPLHEQTGQGSVRKSSLSSQGHAQPKAFALLPTFRLLLRSGKLKQQAAGNGAQRVPVSPEGMISLKERRGEIPLR